MQCLPLSGSTSALRRLIAPSGGCLLPLSADNPVAGALLLAATDRAIDLVDLFASSFHDERRPELIEHSVPTLVGQRVFGIALGYEDLNDHE
jgi:hypothetical protein